MDVPISSTLPPAFSIFSLAAALTALGVARCDWGDPHAAEPLLTEALQIWRRSMPEGHWQVAVTNSALGYAWTRMGRWEEAEALLEQSFTLLERERGMRDPRTRSAAQWLVELYVARGLPQRARMYEELLDPDG